MSKNTSKRFEDWEEVDCNECVHWWDNSCDGVTPRKMNEKGSKMPCNSFLATRNVVIPLQIKSLQRANTRMRVCISLLIVADILHCLVHIFGG